MGQLFDNVALFRIMWFCAAHVCCSVYFDCSLIWDLIGILAALSPPYAWKNHRHFRRERQKRSICGP